MATVLQLADLQRLGWTPALVPIGPNGKAPGMNGVDALGWPTKIWSPAELDADAAAGASFGVRFNISELPCGALDIDTDDAPDSVVGVVVEVARRVIGEGATRYRKDTNRCAIVYRTAAVGAGKDFAHFKDTISERTLDLELFTGSGQLVFGPKHSSGAPYLWDSPPDYARLPIVTLDAAALFGEIAEGLKQYRWKLVGTAHDGGGDALERDASKVADDPLWQALVDKHLVRFTMRNGWAALTCPFESEHTGKRSKRDTSTVYMPPAVGTAAGFVSCRHAHCASRSQAEYAEALGAEIPPDYEIEFPPPAPEPVLTEIRPAGGREPPGPMGAAAFVGLFGEAVDLLEESCEASRENLLVHLLVGFSAVVDQVGVHAGGARLLRAVLQVLIVGDTSRGRKGTGSGMMMDLLERAFPEFVRGVTADTGDLAMPCPPRVLPGISSGEGLIFQIRDSSGNPDSKSFDVGIADKRLLVRLEEFSLLLRTMQREGNVVGEIMRQAFDGGALSVPTRREALYVSRSHIAIYAHVTKAELEHRLEAVAILNGFLNRWAVFHVVRGRIDPSPPPLDEARADAIAAQFRKRLAPYTTPPMRELHLAAPALALWNDELYAMLDSVGEGSAIGEALAARFPAYCKKLALMYAVAAGAKAISVQHLRAAVAVLDYCQRSVDYIFGTGGQTDPTVQRISDTIKEAAGALVPRAVLWKVLQRNATSRQIDEAIAELHQRGRIRVTEGPAGLNGKRPLFYSWID